MTVKLEIRRKADGQTATTLRPDWTSDIVWWWETGNGSCDCNRELFFCRGRNEDEPDETECGDDRFSVRLTDADTGDVLYDELRD